MQFHVLLLLYRVYIISGVKLLGLNLQMLFFPLIDIYPTFLRIFFRYCLHMLIGHMLKTFSVEFVTVVFYKRRVYRLL